MSTTTRELQASGYRCRQETISGQGYLGGDGIVCWRIRRPDGTLAIHRISTFRAPQCAWEEARWIADHASSAGNPEREV